MKDRQDLSVIAVSVVYIVAIIGAIFGWGIADDWSAEKPIDWPDSARFWPKVESSLKSFYQLIEMFKFALRQFSILILPHLKAVFKQHRQQKHQIQFCSYTL